MSKFVAELPNGKVVLADTQEELQAKVKALFAAGAPLEPEESRKSRADQSVARFNEDPFGAPMNPDSFGPAVSPGQAALAAGGVAGGMAGPAALAASVPAIGGVAGAIKGGVIGTGLAMGGSAAMDAMGVPGWLQDIILFSAGRKSGGKGAPSAGKPAPPVQFPGRPGGPPNVQKIAPKDAGFIENAGQASKGVQNDFRGRAHIPSAQQAPPARMEFPPGTNRSTPPEEFKRKMDLYAEQQGSSAEVERLRAQIAALLDSKPKSSSTSRRKPK